MQEKLWIALLAYALLGVLMWRTLSDEKIRLAALAVLLLFVLRTLVHYKRERSAEQ